MTLPAKGNPIGIKDINVELGLTPTYSSSLQFLNGFLAAPQASPNMAAFYGKTYFALITGNCANGNCSASPNNCQYQCTNCSQCTTVNCTTTGATLLQDGGNCAGPTFNCSLVTNQYYNCACACDCDCACDCNCPPPPPSDCAPADCAPADCAPADCAPADCDCNCSKIVCGKLYQYGLLDHNIWTADQVYGRWLRKNDKVMYRGYIRWARVVTQWMDGRGPDFMIWVNKDKRGEAQSKATIKLSTKLGLPWAEHMAYLMGAAKEDNTMGRIIMKNGQPLCRWVDTVPRVPKAHRHSLPVVYGICLIAFSTYYVSYVAAKIIDTTNNIKLAWNKFKNKGIIKDVKK